MGLTYATVSHIKEHHRDTTEKPDFSFKVLKVHKTSLERQLQEALTISNTPCNILMNKKGEWGVNLVPTMTITVLGGLGEWQNYERNDTSDAQDARNDQGRNVVNPELSHRQRKKMRREMLNGQQVSESQPSSENISSSTNSARNDRRNEVTGVRSEGMTQSKPESVRGMTSKRKRI